MTRWSLVVVLLAAGRTTAQPSPVTPEAIGPTEFEWLRVLDARYAPPGDTTLSEFWPGGVVLKTGYEPDLDAGVRVFIGGHDVLVLDGGRVVQQFMIVDSPMEWVDLGRLDELYGMTIYSPDQGLWPAPLDPSVMYRLRLRGSVPVGGECGPVSEQVMGSGCFPSGDIVSPPFRIRFE